MQDFIYDSPKNNLSEDLFGWGSIVERISAAIKYRSSENHSSYTIGIYRKWGKGKTNAYFCLIMSLFSGQIIKSKFSS